MCAPEEAENDCQNGRVFDKKGGRGTTTTLKINKDRYKSLANCASRCAVDFRNV